MSSYEALRCESGRSELVGRGLRVGVEETTAAITINRGDTQVVLADSSCGIVPFSADGVAAGTTPPFASKTLYSDGKEACLELESAPSRPRGWCFAEVGVDKHGVHAEVHYSAPSGMTIVPAVGYRFLIAPSPILLSEGWDVVASHGDASNADSWWVRCEGTAPVTWRLGPFSLHLVHGFSAIELRRAPSTIAVTLKIPPGRRQVRGTLTIVV